jgi:hypothetical protein
MIRKDRTRERINARTHFTDSWYPNRKQYKITMMEEKMTSRVQSV